LPPRNVAIRSSDMSSRLVYCSLVSLGGVVTGKSKIIIIKNNKKKKKKRQIPKMEKKRKKSRER